MSSSAAGRDESLEVRIARIVPPQVSSPARPRVRSIVVAPPRSVFGLLRHAPSASIVFGRSVACERRVRVVAQARGHELELPFAQPVASRRLPGAAPGSTASRHLVGVHRSAARCRRIAWDGALRRRIDRMALGAFHIVPPSTNVRADVPCRGRANPERRPSMDRSLPAAH
jgi:hypothetical protein